MTRISVPVPAPSTVMMASANMIIGSEFRLSKVQHQHAVEPARAIAGDRGPSNSPNAPAIATETMAIVSAVRAP